MNHFAKKNLNISIFSEFCAHCTPINFNPPYKVINFNWIRSKNGLTFASNYAQTCHFPPFLPPGINNNYYLMNYLSVLNLYFLSYSFKQAGIKILRWSCIFKSKDKKNKNYTRKTKPAASNKKLLHVVFMTYLITTASKRLF